MDKYFYAICNLNAQNLISQSSQMRTFGSRMTILLVLSGSLMTVVSHSCPDCVTLTIVPVKIFGTPMMMIRSIRMSCIDFRKDIVDFPFLPRLLETNDFPDSVNFRWIYAPDI